MLVVVAMVLTAWFAYRLGAERPRPGKVAAPAPLPEPAARPAEAVQPPHGPALGGSRGPRRPRL